MTKFVQVGIEAFNIDRIVYVAFPLREEGKQARVYIEMSTDTGAKIRSLNGIGADEFTRWWKERADVSVASDVVVKAQ